MRKILTVIVALLVTHFAKAQTYLSSKDDLSKHSDRVMKFLKDSEFQKAFTELQSCWPLP